MRHPYLFAAKYAYEAFDASHAIQSRIPWDNLDDQTKEQWVFIATAAAQALPAPLAGVISIHTPGGCEPIKHLYRSDTTEESIHKACAELEAWLLDISRSWREQTAGAG